MRKLHILGSAVLLIAAITLTGLFVGCEDEPSTGNVDSFFANNDTTNQDREDGLVPLSITPVLTSVSYVGERIALRAKGAVLPVTWSPANYAAATVTVVGPRSDYAVYQAKMVLPNSVLAVDAAGRTATADILVGGLNGLTITPSAVNIPMESSINVNFVANGGIPPYESWEVAYTNLGNVSSAGVYTSIANTMGTNIVTVVDSDGTIAAATVVQSPSDGYPPLNLTPATATISTNGASVGLLATGGSTGSYSWTHAGPGTFSSSGASATLTHAGTTGTAIISVSDGGNPEQTAISTITLE